MYRKVDLFRGVQSLPEFGDDIIIDIPLFKFTTKVTHLWSEEGYREQGNNLVKKYIHTSYKYVDPRKPDIRDKWTNILIPLNTRVDGIKIPYAYLTFHLNEMTWDEKGGFWHHEDGKDVALMNANVSFYPKTYILK